MVVFSSQQYKRGNRMTITFKIYPVFNFVATLIYLWFLVSALNGRAWTYGGALVVSEWWGWIILAIPPTFLLMDYICERRGIRHWRYIAGILWILVWLGAMFLNGIMMVGIPWLSEGRQDFAPFIYVFLAAAVVNFLVFVATLLLRLYSIKLVKL